MYNELPGSLFFYIPHKKFVGECGQVLNFRVNYTLNNSFRLQTVTLNIFSKWKKTKIAKEKPKITWLSLGHFSRLKKKIDNWKIWHGRFDRATEQFLLSGGKNKITVNWCNKNYAYCMFKWWFIVIFFILSPALNNFFADCGCFFFLIHW